MSAIVEKDYQAAFTHCKTRDTSFSPVQTRNPSIASLTCRAWSFTRSAKRKQLLFNSLKRFENQQSRMSLCSMTTVPCTRSLFSIRYDTVKNLPVSPAKASTFYPRPLDPRHLCVVVVLSSRNLVGNLRNYLWMTKSRLRVIQIYLRSIISNHIERQGL